MRGNFKHFVNGTRIKAGREGAFSYARGGRAPRLGDFKRKRFCANPKNESISGKLTFFHGDKFTKCTGKAGMERPLKIAIVMPDNRDEFRRYADPLPYSGTAPTALLEGLAMLPECEVHVICCVQQPVAAPEKIGPNIYYHTEIVPKWGWLRGGYLGCIRSIRRQLKKIQPDIVHGQGTERYCALSAVLSGFPNVLTIHGNMRLVAAVNHARPFSFQWLAARLEDFTLPRTDGVVCISRYTRDAVQPLARRTWVLPNAVDGSFFDIKSTPLPNTQPVILCVGAICPRKNQNAFIHALDPLAALKKFKVVFLGQADAGPYGANFSQLVAERGWCEHAGFAGRERTKEFFQTATALVLPTLEDNCPMVVLEAMAAGVPVLASKVGGVPDLIEDGKTGLFCDPQQPESFRTGVEQLLAAPALRQRLAVDAKQRAHERFHPQVIARRHLEIYREVLKKAKG
jgi:glycosyltransferase involved in cell wall biosynthesis